MRGVLLVPMGWRGDERVGEYKGEVGSSGGVGWGGVGGVHVK